jgi:hypothetical protein
VRVKVLGSSRAVKEKKTLCRNLFENNFIKSKILKRPSSRAKESFTKIEFEKEK